MLLKKLKLWINQKFINFLYKETILKYESFSLLSLEQQKLKEMYSYYKEVSWINTESILRDLRICIRLLDYILEKESIISTMYKENGKWVIEYTKYVNTKNRSRFLPVISWNDYFLDELYKQKALCLYHKIRYYKMQTWWS